MIYLLASFISLFTPPAEEASQDFSMLENRKLKGFSVWDEKELIKLPTEEIDLAHGLLLTELGKDAREQILKYERDLDLMAVKILERLSPESTDLEKVRAISDYVFSDMRFRFPPHSLHAKNIDVYTFLPSVLDSRRGVCLGVSILYLSLAQRLGLKLEAVTPPGHIYVRYRDNDGELYNIETTARGIDVPSKRYLNIETKKLQERSIKEVIGLAFMNQAAALWHHSDPKGAIALYEKARPFLGDDYLLNMFLGMNYIFDGREAEGIALFKKVAGKIPDHAISADTVSEDFLAKKCDREALRAIFAEVDETRESIIKKQKQIEEVLKKFPKFRQGWFHLGITWLQLGREKEALPILEKYIALSPNDATANYYLSAIHFQRHNYNKAWKYLKASEKIVFAKDHTPEALKDLRLALARACPEPLQSI